MKKILLPALALTGAILLYNCTGDDATLLNNTNETLDSLQPGDSTAIDSTWTGGDTAVVPVDSVYVPVDSIYYPGDSTVVIEPYPGDPENPADSVYTPIDSITNGRLAYPRQHYPEFDHTKRQ